MTLSKMKVDRLRAELKSRGLNTSGTKPILVARLQAAMDAEDPPSASEAPADPDTACTSVSATQTMGFSAQAEPAAAETATIANVSDKPITKPSTNPEFQAIEKPNESKIASGDAGCGGGSGVVVAAASDAACLSMEQRVVARSARFGGTVEGRLAARARRFGLNHNGVGKASEKSEATGAGRAATGDSVSVLEHGKRSTGRVATRNMLPVSAEEQVRRAKRAKRFA